MDNYAIIVKNISKTFQLQSDRLKKTSSSIIKIKSTDNISLKIEQGKMVGLIGRNGSGKTTLLRLIAGILYPDEGSVETSGKIGPLLQVGVGTTEEFTVNENIITYGILLGFKEKSIKEKISEILKFAELEEYGNVKMKYLSSGMKVRVMFSTAMLIDPDILLVDEIISVGDEAFRKKSFEAFLSFKNRKKTILFVSHNLEMVKQLCDIVYLLEKGKIIEFGEPEKVIKTYQDRNKK